MVVEVHIDGACEPMNPGGTASWGVIVYKVKEDTLSGLVLGVVRGVVEGTESPFKEIWSSYGIVGSGPEMSNNVGEYAALVAFLKWLDYMVLEDLSTHTSEDQTEDYYRHLEASSGIVIRSDSNMLVQQMSGKFRASKGLYIPYYHDAKVRLGQLPQAVRNSIRFEWIPREQNLADALSVMALNEVGIYRRTK